MGRDAISAKQAVLALGTALNDQKANQLVVDAINGKPVDPLLKPYKAPAAPRKAPAAPSTVARDELGRDFGDKIASIVGQFDDTPAIIDKTNVKVRQLDDLIDDLSRKKPPGFEALIASAEQAKITVRGGLVGELAKGFEAPKTAAERAAVAVGQLDTVIADLSKNKPPGFEGVIASARQAETAIQDGLQRPYQDFIRSQAEALEVQQLLTHGRTDEANALRQVQQLQASMGTLTDAQKDSVLATVQAMRAEQRQLDVLREKNAKYVEALGSIKGIVQDATQAFVRGDLEQLIKSPGKLLDAFQTLQGRKLFDSLFGDAFRELEDQANGTGAVRDASERMGAAVHQVATKTATTAAAIDRLGSSAGQAAAALKGGSLIGGGGDLAALLAQGNGVTGPGPDGGPGRDIEVIGKKLFDPFSQSIGKVATSLTGLFTAPESAKEIGGQIGKFAGKAFTGAGEGQMAAGFASMLGIKTDGTGAALGGALGGLTGIPGGSIIGGLLGGIVGGLFQKPKYGTASVTSGDGKATTAGSSGTYEAQASGLGGSIQDSLHQIADQLGASLGDFSVAIGTFDGKYRVNTSATTASLNYHNFSDATLKNFGDDQGAAISFAIADAIRDGAVQRLSQAQTLALQSSDDLNKAVNQAIKVGQLELDLSGVQGQIDKVFKDFDRNAAQRVDLAKKYGLDLLAVEKLNADQRADLIEKTLTERVSGLKDLLSNIQYGDLFEGSATERRSAVKGEIADA